MVKYIESHDIKKNYLIWSFTHKRFFGLKGKKALAEGRSPLHELKVDLRSGLYVLVIIVVVTIRLLYLLLCEQLITSIFHTCIKQVVSFKLDGVGPVENRPYTDQRHQFVQFF